MELTLNVEFLGYLASILTVVSLMMSRVLRLRIINLLGSIAWVMYGLVISSPSIMIANSIIILINIYHLYQIWGSKEYFSFINIRNNSLFLLNFLNMFEREIKKYYPDFKFDPDQPIFCFFAMRNTTTAGLFIIEKIENNDLKLILDFVIPGYRDFKLGNYVYQLDSDIMTSLVNQGYRRLYSPLPSKSHGEYLEKMGFVKDPTDEHLCYLDLRERVTSKLKNPDA
ncbi:hypothetical protein MASR2M15_27930 [Anaerolineales bacterium]